MAVTHPYRSYLPLNPSSIPVPTDAGEPMAPWFSTSFGAPVPLQRKLVIGSTTDPLEAEADRVADQVMGMTAPAPQLHTSAAGPAIRRKCSCGSSGGECPECKKKVETLHRKAQSPVTPIEAPPIVHEVLRSPGQPLDTPTRAFFEQRFGSDFSHVRIHTGDHAADSARSVNARAYTVGNHLVFGANRYQPSNAQGRLLIAHELTHVLQQRGDAKLVQRGPETTANSPTLPQTGSIDPELSPRYIDKLFDSVSGPSILNGATTFYWKEGGKERKVTIPLKDLEQDESVASLAIWIVHKSKADALKTVAIYAQQLAAQGFVYYSYYTTADGVIMPTLFSKTSTPQFHKLWPDLKRLNAEKAEDISRGLQQLANSINPFPCTQVDANGNLTASINFSNCALPILLHAYSIHSSTHGHGSPGPENESRPAAKSGDAPEKSDSTSPPSTNEVAAPKSDIESFARKNGIEPRQLAAEVNELGKDTAKVHAPTDPHSPYDAEMKASDGHELLRDKDTGLWERCSTRCKKGLKVPPEVNREVDAELKKRRSRKAAPRTASDVISSGTDSLQPGKSELGHYGIDKYSTFSNRPQDRFAGHELLQNLWLEVKGYGERLVGPASRNNPAIALTHDEHVAVGREQRAMGLFDRAKLSKMSATQVIEANAQAMERAGIPDYVIETLKKEALDYAATLKPPRKGAK